MNVVRIRPSAAPGRQEIAEIAVSTDQCTLKLSSLISSMSRSFKFDRIFTPSYPISAFYESACLSAAEDVLYGRRSMAIVVLGLPASGKTYTSIAIIRRTLLLALKKIPEGGYVTLVAVYLNEIAPMQEKVLLEHNFYATDDSICLERTLGRAVQEYARVQNPHSGLLLRVQEKGATTELRVLDTSSQELPLLQALHKHLTTRSLLALRESKMLQHMRSVYPGKNMTCSETQILTISCVDYNAIYDNARFQDTMKQLAFAETLSYARQSQTAVLDSLTGTSSMLGNRSSYCMPTPGTNEDRGKNSLDARSSIDVAVHQETVHQALRVQTALQERLKAVKDQLSLVETALSEEKARNGLRENELQSEVVGLQSRVESLLAKNFSLEQENKLLRDELDRIKAKPPPADHGSRPNTVRFLHQPEATQVATGRVDAIRSASFSGITQNQESFMTASQDTYRVRPAVAAGLSLPRNEDEFDTFLLQATTMNRELKNRGAVDF